MKISKACILIPARYGSSRFPGKPLALILGIPMIVRVAKTCQEAVGREATFVVTDDERIADVCRVNEINFIMSEGNFDTGTDRIASVLDSIEADIILNVQGDEPCISVTDIKAAIIAKQENPNCVVNGYCPIELDPNEENLSIPKVVINESGKLIYISRANIPIKYKNHPRNVKQVYLRQVCIYAYGRDELRKFANFGSRGLVESQEDIEIIRFLENEIPVKMIPMSPSIAVDFPSDLKIVCEYLERGKRDDF